MKPQKPCKKYGHTVGRDKDSYCLGCRALANKANKTNSLRCRRKNLGWKAGEHERAQALKSDVRYCACCFGMDPHHKNGWSGDHNAKTGMFRAWVCNPCNQMIGFAERYGMDAGIRVEAYLEKYNG